MVEESWLETNFNEDYEINSLIVDVDILRNTSKNGAGLS